MCLLLPLSEVIGLAKTGHHSHTRQTRSIVVVVVDDDDDSLFIVALIIEALSWFCYALLCALSSFAIIWLGKRELAALHILCYCHVRNQGGGGIWGPDPPGKSQFLWVFYRN